MSNPQKKKKGGRTQKHQNKEKFYHNPNSVLTKKIAGIEHTCLCDRCLQQIEWRKDFRKYKPLKEPRRCNSCLDKTVNRAYHTICEKCARDKGICAKCIKPCEASTIPVAITEEEVLHIIEFSCAKERFKRTIMRQWERGLLSNENVILLIHTAEDGTELDWKKYSEEIDGDFSDNDDVNPKTTGKTKVMDNEEMKARVIRVGDIDTEIGTTHVTEKLAEFRI